VTFSQELL
jgi:hypothetical protein